MITPLQAAKQVGKTKAAILKAIKSGRLTATKDANGQWCIHPAELFRVYPAVNKEDENISTQEYSGLLRELELLRQQCAGLEERLAEVREDRDHWRQQATALLSDMRSKSPQKPPEGRLSRAWSVLTGKN